MMEYRKLFLEMEKWWSCAGHDARQKFLEELSKTHLPSPTPVYETNTKKVDYSYCVDFSNDVYRLGDKVVYIYTTPNGLPFYVGMGTYWRPTNINSRSNAFVDEFTKTNKAKIFIVAKYLDEYYADEIETLCIWFLLTKHWSLCNSAKTKIDVEVLDMLEEKYPEVVSILEELNDYLFENLLDEGFSDDKFVLRIGKDERYHSENIWEIDGEIKTAAEWCREYGESVSGALQRIIKFRMTPKEALTFPKMTYKPYGESALQWWKNRGYVPGTDTTSRIVSINFCGCKNVDDMADQKQTLNGCGKLAI